MRFLSIVDRELRVASRRRTTYWMRTWVAMAALAVSSWIFLVTLRETPREVAQILFYLLTGGAAFFCLLAGFMGTADCLSEEKREGTLGLLFLTDLRGYDVVIGKLVASSLNSFYAVLAIVPVLAIPLLMGGVSPAEFVREAAVVMNTLFFSLCVGMFASAVCRLARNAIGLMLIVLALITLGLPGLGLWLVRHTRPEDINWAFLVPSPACTFATGIAPVFLIRAKEFYWSLGTVHALSWVFLGLASLIAPHSWQDRPAGRRLTAWRGHWRTWSAGNADERRRFRNRLLDINPFFWLAARPRSKPIAAWLGLTVLGCLWLWGYLKFTRDWLDPAIYVATAIVLNTLLKLWVVAEASRQLGEDRRVGSLELLLSTPLTVPDILRGQALALQRQFFWPGVVVVVAEIAMMLAGASETYHEESLTSWFTVWVAGLIMLLLDLLALYWLGMWMGLAAKSPKHAAGNAAVLILALPSAGFAVLMTGTMVTLELLRINTRWVEWYVPLALWFAMGLLADVVFGLSARRKLLTQFRTVATQRYQARVPLWKRLFGATSNPPPP